MVSRDYPFGPERARKPMASPLNGLKVIDFTRARAGPTCVRVLADWGADVIKVESADEKSRDNFSGRREGSDFQNLHRNKRSMVLDLKQQEGRALLYEMVKRADIVVENYRPDVKYRLGIDYETLKKINPRIIYGSVSGFGQTGPYAKRPGVDQIAQGLSGLMSVTGRPGEGPLRVGIALADLSGGLFCAMGILLALYEREKSGEGQWVQSSLLGAQISLLDFQAARWLIDHEVPGPAGNDHPTLIPTGVFKTKDGHVNIAAAGNDMFPRLCRATGLDDMIGDPRFADDALRSKNRVALHAEIAERFSTRHTSAEAVEKLNAAGIPCGPIYTIDQVFADPQVKQLGIAQPIDHPTLGRLNVVGQPMSLSRTPSEMRMPTPDFGQHTEEVLTEMGYDHTAIAGLRQRGVII
jgi:crotonobetainyl-CoA:carnitine CoA-transferase CaiB-like acyl-CoA transferase